MSVVAIVGRPNVGKSALFNRIIGKRTALVSDMPGVTRDRHYGEANWVGVEFTIIDTGGLSFDETDKVEAKVHKQSLAALHEADVVICLFDGASEITSLDRDIVDIFRKSGKKVIYVANKIDTESRDHLVFTFSEIGVDVISVSAEHGRNIDTLLDELISLLPKEQLHSKKRSRGIRIAIAGRPNVGKSTIINYLASEERVIAHDKPGTTRDSIDVLVKFKDEEFILVDTAGIKKKSKTQDKIDKFTTLKSLRAIEDAEVVFVVIDAEDGITRQDLSLIAHSFELYKPTAVLVNKWDKIAQSSKLERQSKIDEKDYIDNVDFDLKELGGIPIMCISGKTGYNCEKIFGAAQSLKVARNRRIKTAALNKFFRGFVESHPAPDSSGKHVKLNYITQVDVRPPAFVVFTNQPKGIAYSYKRYLTNSLLKLLGKPRIPISLRFRSK